MSVEAMFLSAAVIVVTLPERILIALCRPAR
jgi:hypothetical protein